jgi:hypothetical protein
MTTKTRTRRKPAPEPQPTEQAEEPMHPTLAEALQIANVLHDRYGVPFGYGVMENTAEMKPSVQAEAALMLFIELGLATPEQVNDIVFGVLRDRLARILETVTERATKPQIIVPGASEAPPPELIARSKR